jgi:hypothetical protein
VNVNHLLDVVKTVKNKYKNTMDTVSTENARSAVIDSVFPLSGELEALNCGIYTSTLVSTPTDLHLANLPSTPSKKGVDPRTYTLPPLEAWHLRYPNFNMSQNLD